MQQNLTPGHRAPRRLAGLTGSLITGLVALAVSASAATNPIDTEAAWWTDYEAAISRAREEDRAILLNFTGSDWCVWCHRLRDEVFVQSPFIEYASGNLLLVEVDFPRRTRLSGDVESQNRRLAERFDVSGYPTIVVLNSDAEEIGRLSYMQGGAKTFVRELKRMIAADRKKRQTTEATPSD